MDVFSKKSAGFGIDRIDMPQIKSEDHASFTTFAKARGVKNKIKRLNPDKLKPTQNDFNPDKVEAIKQNGTRQRSIITSKDGHIVDGHHQWLAAKEEGKPVKTMVLDTDIHKALNLARSFPSATKAEGGPVDVPSPPDRPLEFSPQDAENAFPAMWKNVDPVVKFNPGRDHNWAETYGPEETGDPRRPETRRPKEFPYGRTGIEVYNPRNKGVDLGLELLHQDRRAINTRNALLPTISPQQKEHLKRGWGDYDESIDQKLFEDRAMQNVVDAMERTYLANKTGLPHHQGPQRAIDDLELTDQQKGLLDRLYGYTQTGKYSEGGKIERKTFEPIHGLRITPPAEELSSEPDIRDYQIKRHAHEFEGADEPVAPRRPVILDAPLFGGKHQVGTLPYKYAPAVERALNLAYGQKTLPLYFNRVTAPLGVALDAYEASRFVGRDPKDVKNYTGLPGLLMAAGKRTLPFMGIGASIGAGDLVAKDTEEGDTVDDRKKHSRGGAETQSAPLPSRDMGRRSWETEMDRLRRMMENVEKDENAFDRAPYKEGGYVGNKAIQNALRLANEGKFRLHQTLARTGYASGGVANAAAKKLIEEIDELIPHLAKGGRAKSHSQDEYSEPEPGSAEYWAQKGLIYMRPSDVRKEDPKDPMRYISPKEYNKGYMGRGEYVMADGGRIGLATGGDPTNINPTGNPVVATNQPQTQIPTDPTRGYVQSLYQNIMSRPGEQSGVDYWTNLLNNGVINQPGVLQQFANSQEFQNLYKQDPKKAVSSLYQTALARDPEQSGIDYWTNQARQGMKLGDMVRGFTGSHEGRSVQDINALYQEMTGNVATRDQIQTALKELTPDTDYMDYIRKTFPIQEPVDGVQEAKDKSTKSDATSVSSTPSAPKAKIWGDVTAGPITEGGMKFLDFTSSGEGKYDTVREKIGKGYKANYNYSVDDKPLSQLTVGDVLNLQKQGKFRAAGRYQFMPDTLSEVVKQTGIDLNQKFDQKTQDQLAMFRAYSKRPRLMSYLEGRSNDVQGAMLDLAKEWRSFPDPKTGLPVKGGNNKVSHTVAETKKMLASLRGQMISGNAVDPAVAGAATTQSDLYSQALEKYNKDFNDWNAQVQQYKFLAAVNHWDPNIPWNLQVSKPQAPNKADYPAGGPSTGIAPQLTNEGAGGGTYGSGIFGPQSYNITPANDSIFGYSQWTPQSAGIYPNTGQTPVNWAQISSFDPYTGQYSPTQFDPMTGIGIHSAAYIGPGQYDLGLIPQNDIPLGVTPLWGAKNGGVIKPDAEDVENALRVAKKYGGRRVNSRIDKDPSFDMSLKSGGGAWTRKEGKNPEGGLNAKGRASAKAEGHNLKPPAPHPKTDKDAARRKSFCARMKGMKEKLTSSEKADDPDSRINKSLRVWNCHDSGGVVSDALRLADGGDVWNKPRPKKLGESDALSKSQKKSAKAAAKAAGRPYPNLVDNMRAAKHKK